MLCLSSALMQREDCTHVLWRRALAGCVPKSGFVSFEFINARENQSFAAVVLRQTFDVALGCLFNLVYRISCLAAGQGLCRTGRMSDLTSCHLSRCPQLIFWSVSESSRQKAHAARQMMETSLNIVHSPLPERSSWHFCHVHPDSCCRFTMVRIGHVAL